MDNLIFRGTQYRRSPQDMPPVSLELAGKYRGTPSTIKHYTSSDPISGELVKLQFMGRSYKRVLW